MPTLQGAGVAVRKEGTLYVKQRFGLGKRAKKALLNGTILSLSDADRAGPCVHHELAKAKIQVQRANFRILLLLANKEKLSMYTTDAYELEGWLLKITDAVQWRVQRFYDLGDELGRGAFSVVHKGINKTTGEAVAIKVIAKNDCSEEDMKYLQREVDITRQLTHDHVTSTRECFESDNSLYIVVEYMEGGTLTDVMASFGRLSETSAKLVMENIFSGLEYCHSKGVVHRDIKPDNLLCSRKALPTIVKLTDFGLARRTLVESVFSGTEIEDDSLGPDGMMTTPVGTPNFVAPEVLYGLPYGKEVDLFSCGVVLYHMLSGVYPFEDPDPKMLITRIKKSDYNFKAPEWAVISDDAKALINGLLDRSPYTRLSAKDALNHTWISGPHRTTSEYSVRETAVHGSHKASTFKAGSSRGSLGLQSSIEVEALHSACERRQSRLEARNSQNWDSPVSFQASEGNFSYSSEDESNP